MELGMVGLGRMGAKMAERLLRRGHRVVGYDPRTEAVDRLVEAGGRGAPALAEVVDHLSPPRAVWLMVPSGDPVDQAIDTLLPLLARGDVIIDGGNSYYKDSVRRYRRVGDRGAAFVDVGTSGGGWGLREGYCLMIGGDPEIVARLNPVFQALAPAPDRGGARWVRPERATTSRWCTTLLSTA